MPLFSTHHGTLEQPNLQSTDTSSTDSTELQHPKRQLLPCFYFKSPAVILFPGSPAHVREAERPSVPTRTLLRDGKYSRPLQQQQGSIQGAAERPRRHGRLRPGASAPRPAAPGRRAGAAAVPARSRSGAPRHQRDPGLPPPAPELREGRGSSCTSASSRARRHRGGTNFSFSEGFFFFF